MSVPVKLKTCLLTILLLTAPLLAGTAQATAYEVSRLASQLNFVSTRFSHDLRGSHGYSSVRFSADRLSREAEQLVEAISRDRSHSYIRSQVDDVRRRYEDLEKAVLRIDGGRNKAFVFEQMDQINSLYTALNAEFFYERDLRRAPQYYYPPATVIVPRQYYLPQGRQINRRHGYDYRDESRDREQRRGTGRNTAGFVSDNNRHYDHRYDHQSPVLNRQHRRAGENGWRAGQGQRRTETQRRNHHE